MKAPICSVCVSSDILCTGCEDKVKQGIISQHDVDLARAIIRLSAEHPSLEHSEFKQTIPFKDALLVIVPKGMASTFIGRQGFLIKEISNVLGKKRIKVVEETQRPKDFVEKVLYPAQLLGVNVVYDGKKQQYKIRVAHSDRHKVYAQEELEVLFEKLLGAQTKIVFE